MKRSIICLALCGGCHHEAPPAMTNVPLLGWAPTRAPGFVAIYRWTVKAGCEDAVRAAWRIEADRYRTRYESCGARLHREDDGTFVSTAFWPSREAWAAAPRPVDTPDAEAALNRCIVSKVEELHLIPVEDVAAPTCP